MDDTSVLVTGGAGFIGSSLANRLSFDNDVLVLDDQSLGDARELNTNVDYQNESVLAADLPTDVDVIFHLAALSSITDHEKDIDQLRGGVEINVKGFVNVVEQARRSGCNTVIYASSSAVYGSRMDPVTEDVDVAAPNAYAASKLAREKYAEYFANAYEMNMAGMRFFSVYREPTGRGTSVRTASNIITKLAEDIANERAPVVFGDGTHRRDFIHVDDVVRGLELAADHELTGVFNLGTGQSHTINEIIRMLKATFDSEIQPTFTENPIPDHMFIDRLVADVTKMRNETGWSPRIGISEGIERIRMAYESQ